MKILTGFFLLNALSLFAGTAGNSDMSIVYSIAGVFFVVMLIVEYLVKRIKRRKALHAAHE